MHKMLVAGLLTAVVLAGCKKSDTELPSPIIPENESQSFTWNHTAGSYWVYQWYHIDSLGNEAPHSTPDSIIVLGDTVLNGHTYTTFYQDHLLLQPAIVYQRDSSGYIVNDSGNIQFSYTAFNDTVGEFDVGGLFTIHHVLGGVGDQVNVPAGEFDVYHKREALELGEEHPPVTCTQSLGFDTYYDANTGVPVIQQTSYVAIYLASCEHYERRLVEYYIAE